MIRQLSVWEWVAPFRSETRVGRRARGAVWGGAFGFLLRLAPHMPGHMFPVWELGNRTHLSCCSWKCKHYKITPVLVAVQGRGRGADRPRGHERGHGPGECWGKGAQRRQLTAHTAMVGTLPPKRSVVNGVQETAWPRRREAGSFLLRPEGASRAYRTNLAIRYLADAVFFNIFEIVANVGKARDFIS